MKNIHILPTDQPTSVLYGKDDKYKLANSTMGMDWFISSSGYKPQHIYITSSEEIKVGDHILDIVNGEVMISKGKMLNNPYVKKIIITTDPKLIADGVQSIDDEFLEWFVKNSSCVFVEVKSEWKLLGNDYEHNGYATLVYKIIIPQEVYICPHTKIQCDDECCVSAEDCHITSSLASGIVEPKQETLEEAAKECYPIHPSLQHSTEYKSSIAEKRLAFMFGANYQAEKMYSEEEVFSILEKVFHMYASNHRKDAKDWFEQFKKK
jgi:hypothetical protein